MTEYDRHVDLLTGLVHAVPCEGTTPVTWWEAQHLGLRKCPMCFGGDE